MARLKAKASVTQRWHIKLQDGGLHKRGGTPESSSEAALPSPIPHTRHTDTGNVTG